MDAIDYAALSESRYTDFHRNDEVFKALIQTLAQQKLDRQTQYINFAKDFLDIDKSEGKALDAIGKVIGQKRELANFIDEPYFGFQGARYAEAFDVGYWYSQNKGKLGSLKIANDEQYRRLIKARIINNKTWCTRNELLSIVNLLTGNDKSEIDEIRHGVFQVKVSGDADGIASYFIPKYRDADTIFSIPLGYRMSVRYVDIDDGGGDWDVSCVGATTSFRLDSILGEYSLYIDNETEPKVTGDSAVIKTYTDDNMSDSLFIENDGFMDFIALSSQNLKVRLVPVQDATATLNAQSNPTLGVDSNGAITACLAGI